MLPQLRSKSKTPNSAFTPLARADNEDNLQWGTRAVGEMQTDGSVAWSYVVLLGGSDTMSFRLRVAQSHLRRDMLPSYWSESLFMRLVGPDVSKAKVIHVPLLQPPRALMATRTNGVVERSLKDFADPIKWPNIAIIALPLPYSSLLEKIDAFKRSRGTLDALEHILKWLAFSWGVARTPNPLNDGVGLPSSCMLETACAAAGFDLTPGLESRASCPEAIWVAARYWHEYFEEFAGERPSGRYTTPHKFSIEDEPHERTPRQR